MPTFTVSQCRQMGIKMETRLPASAMLETAEAWFKTDDTTRALVERGRTSFTEFTLRSPMTLMEVAALTLGSKGHWTVLGLLNRDIEDLCRVPQTLKPGLVLRIPAAEKSSTSHVAELPPKAHASTYASHTSAAVQHGTQQRTTSPMQTMCNARIERAAKRTDLLERIVASFELMAHAGAPTKYLGLEDARAVACAAKDAFPPSVVRVAHDMLRDPDAVALADLTSPWVGPHAHDATNDKEEYVRALSLMKMRGDVSWLCDHVLAHFDDIAGGKPSLSRDALAAWTPCMHMLTRKLGTPGDVVPQTDLLTVLVQASNNAAHTGDVVTLEGVLRLKALVNGKSISCS
jgi:hypothetical protein